MPSTKGRIPVSGTSGAPVRFRRLGNTAANTCLATASAALLVLASPGYGYYLLAWVALVPLLIALHRSGPLGALGWCLLAGQLFYFGHLSWFWNVEGITPLTFTLAGLANAWLWGLFGAAAVLFRRRRASDVLLFPSLWVLAEYLHHHLGFLSLTWGTLAYTQYRVPAVNWVASIAGIYGVSFLIVLVNVCVFYFVLSLRLTGRAECGRGKPRLGFSGAGPLALAGAGVALVVLLGLARSEVGGQTRSFRAALVQSGLPGYSSASSEEKREALERLLQLSRETVPEGPGLVVWPETAVPGTIPFDSTLVKVLFQIPRESEIPLLVGAAGYDKFRSSERQETGIANSAFLFKPGDKGVTRYEKMMLVPFNEYLPLRGRVPWPTWIVGTNWKDAHPGTDMTIFQVGGARFGVQICWENLFPDLFRRVASRNVDFMVSMTNESFVRSPAAREQMLAFNAFRAIENRVGILRSAATGISAIISPGGRIIALRDGEGEPLYGAGKLVGSVQATRNRSFYSRHGDWLIAVLAALLCSYCLILLGEKVIKARSSRSVPEGPGGRVCAGGG